MNTQPGQQPTPPEPVTESGDIFESKSNTSKVGLFAVIILLFIVITASILFRRVIGVQPDIPLPSAGTEIIVMVSLPLLHPSTASFTNGILLAFEEIDYKAKGYTISVPILDSGAEDGIANLRQEETNAELAAANPAVVAYIGPFYSIEAKASMPILNRAGLIQISPATTWPGLTRPGFAPGEPGFFYPSGNRHFYRVMPNDELQGSLTAVWIEILEQANIVVVDDGSIEGSGVASLFQHRAKKRGINVMAHHTLLAERLIDDILTDIEELGTDIVYFGGGMTDKSIAFIRTLRETLPDVIVVGSHGIHTDEFITRLGEELAEGIYSTTYGLPSSELTSQRGEHFRLAYRARYGEEPDEESMFGYEAAQVVIQALHTGDAHIDRASVRQAMLEIEQYKGIFGEWFFDEYGDSTIDTLSAHVIENGKFQYIGELQVR